MNYAGIITREHFRIAEVERFWALVERGAPDQCWLWKGRTSKAKYGAVYGVWTCSGEIYKPHRVAYALEYGELKTGLTIDHVKARGCTSKLCCNPGHLEAVTQSENVGRYWRESQEEREFCLCGAPRRPGGKDRKCAVCWAVYHREYRKKNPEKHRKLSETNNRKWRTELRLFSVANIGILDPAEKKRKWAEWKRKVLEREKENPLYHPPRRVDRGGTIGVNRWYSGGN